MNKLKPYDKYQPVQYDYVKELPYDWKLLPNIAIFQERIEKGFVDEELLSVTIGKGVIRQKELDKKDSSTLDKSKYLLIHPGDLVYSMRFRQGASGYSIYKGIVSPACTVLKPKRNIKINPKYFFYMFRTGFYKNYVERFAYGIADGQIPLRYKDFKRIYSIAPPLETQNSIVEYLDRKTKQIQKFISKKERLIELLEEKRNKAIFSFITFGNTKINTIQTSIEWQLNTPIHWKEYKLKYLLSKPVSGQWGDEPNNSDNDIICVRIADYQSLNISTGNLTKRNIKANPNIILLKGDLLIEKSGGGEKTPVGRVVIFNKDFRAVTSNFISKTTPNSKLIISKYLLYIFKVINDVRWNVKSIKQTTGIQNIDIGHYLDNKVYIPDLSEQKNILKLIERKISKVDRLISKAQSEITKIKEYQESLITNIVTGKLKVPTHTKAECNE